MHPVSKLLGAYRRGWQVSVYGGSCRLCFALNVASLRETKNLRPLNEDAALRERQKKVSRNGATTQRKSASDG